MRPATVEGLTRVAAMLRRMYGRPRIEVCWLDREEDDGPCDAGNSCIDTTCEAPACAAGSERGPSSDE